MYFRCLRIKAYEESGMSLRDWMSIVVTAELLLSCDEIH